MPELENRLENQWRRSFAARAAMLALSLGLAACKTTETMTTAGTTAGGTQPPPVTAGRSAGTATTASGGYVDPALVSAAASGTESSFSQSDDPSLTAPSLAETVNRPTGIRAGSTSIFSSGTPPVATGGEPYPPPSGRIDARSGSMFNAPGAASAGAADDCGTDAQGYPLSC